MVLMAFGTSEGLAAVTEGDHGVHGTGTLTIDSDQELAFLDVNLSLGRSFNDISSQFGLGGDFEGFRYANQSEVRALMVNFGIQIQTTAFGSNGEEFAQLSSQTDLLNFVNLLGPTSQDSSIVRIEGITDDIVTEENSLTTRRRTEILYFFGGSPSEELRMGYAQDMSFTLPQVGSWLVQDNVPTPSGLAVVAFGALATSRRR